MYINYAILSIKSQYIEQTKQRYRSHNTQMIIVFRAPSRCRGRKPLRLAYDSLRLASRLAVVSTTAA